MLKVSLSLRHSERQRGIRGMESRCRPDSSRSAALGMTWILLVSLIAAVPASAQQRLNVDVPGLADRASEVVDITLDASMLRLASKFLSGHDGDERAVRDVVQGLTGIYVRSYEFEKDGEYDRGIVDRVRGQLGANWKKIVNVRGKKENVEVYTEMSGENITGLVVISAKPRELTLVNIVGPIDLDKLSRIEGQFGIPRVSGKKEKEP